ncbi:S41 family peptidase [uncultured Chitinophaga sp.]|jgi:Periplasmic protease|uniref:S41 family peptidase n=1 Tax=uncultured Chitinophaga sp. TaxID=339340 RepID=UPI00262DD13D|nr:S41 family peptidase [uncultured Chitinophaga sp.]
MKLFIFFLALSLPVQAQWRPLTSQTKDSAVNNIAALIKEHYVFKEKGKQIATDLLQQYRRGALDKAGNWQVFDSLVTGIIKTSGKDGHLYVRYDPPTVKSLQVPEDSTAEQEDLFLHGPDARNRNYGFREVKILDHNIGYIKVDEINISVKSLPVLYAAMQLVANTRALVIDLRDNGGGGSDIGPVFESFFLPANKVLLEVKGRNSILESVKTVGWLTQEKYKQPLYILVNKNTASAAEAFAFTLQAQRRAVIIGQPSAGGAHMNSWYPVNDEIYVSVSTAAPVLPGTEVSWEGKGVQPDHVVEEGKELEVVMGVGN